MNADIGDVRGGDGSHSRLTAEQLARESDSSLGLVQQLVDVGAIHPDAEGLHPARDVMVVRLARALADGGVDIEGLRWAMQNGILPLDRLAEMWSIPLLTGRTYAEFTSALGDRAEELPAIYAAFGLAAPLPQTETRADEEAVLMRFIDLWSLLDGGRDVYLRAARITGEGIRRIDAATLDLFDELDGSPPQRLRAGFSEDDANLPSALLGALMPVLYDWLHTRHLEHEVFERIVHFVERALVRSGGTDVLDREPPAIAFVDLAGYTAMTQAIGDDAAARSLLSMQALAEAAAVAHGGRVVKLLGDGVMLRYASAGEAVASVRDLMREIAAAGLPPAHAGIAAGPIVARDGDVYGHTVNLAARIAGVASAGELLVTRELAEGLGPGSTAWQDVGVVQLKGIEGGVTLVRIESP